jgi:predicted nucleic acid-binding protein
VSGQDPHKQIIARRLMQESGPAKLTISTQVLGEAYNVLRRRLGWPAREALAVVQTLMTLDVVTATLDTVAQGLALAEAHQLSGWDAILVQTAQQTGCDTLFSEDMQAGRKFGGLQIVNPFALAAHEPTAALATPASQPARPARRKAGPKPAARSA